MQDQVKTTVGNDKLPQVNDVDKDCKLLEKAIIIRKERDDKETSDQSGKAAHGERIDQGTDLQVEFDISLIRCRISVTKRNATVLPIANFTMNSVKVGYLKKTLSQVADLKLRDVSFEYLDCSGKRLRTVSLISGNIKRGLNNCAPKHGEAKQENSEAFFVSIHYVKIDEPSYRPPELKEKDADILSKLELDVGHLVVTFQHEAAIGLLQFSYSIQNQIEKVKKRVKGLETQTSDPKTLVPKTPALKGF